MTFIPEVIVLDSLKRRLIMEKIVGLVFEKNNGALKDFISSKQRQSKKIYRQFAIIYVYIYTSLSARLQRRDILILKRCSLAYGVNNRILGTIYYD
ncbi:hypothetical protein TNIN_381691 [Trichonephila inaurata madagascariensis]|uniref:Uncharacterized protein n=1 Tax=Trichonephila inaurata madagascariensis TaxID=2747483 RepID=A0A8X7CMS5_9ARAC|nr:hypothetical protein TNIN_381691 [Trichonephila inaurata madagascariensis]